MTLVFQNFKLQSETLMLAIEPDIVVLDKQVKKALATES